MDEAKELKKQIYEDMRIVEALEKLKITFFNK